MTDPIRTPQEAIAFAAYTADNCDYPKAAPTEAEAACYDAMAERIRDAITLLADRIPATDDEAPPLSVIYTNWRGETSTRRIVPKSVRFGSTEWHPKPQWLILATDVDKGADREFAMADMRPVTPPADDETTVEAMARAMDPAAWAMTEPAWRDGLEKWHIRRQESVKKARAVRAALVPPGWVMVPVEATQTMIDAGERHDKTHPLAALGKAPVRELYAAMLAAAPKQGGGDEH
jgi:hypothetical protein